MKVVIRVRPFKNYEVKTEGKFEGKTLQSIRNIIAVTEDNLIFDPLEVRKDFYFHGKKQIRRDVTIKVNKNLSFNFDDIFDDCAKNREVFERLMKPMVHSLMDGFNCSLLNYGATGTGKTHTMLGNNKERGIIYLTMEYVFFQLNKRLSNEWNYEISVSYMEVYNEQIINLLTKSRLLTIMKRNTGEVNFSGVSLKKVNNLSEVQKLLTMGNRNRTKHCSANNNHNTQSHAIFEVYISMPNRLSNGESVVKLTITELGGSERNNTAQNRPKNPTDAVNINKSIFTFKNCLHRLSEGSKDIPFKDSQLTNILKTSFDVNCQAVMLFNLSSSSLNYEDTYNTLLYANRARLIGKTLENKAIPSESNSIQQQGSLKRNLSYTISTEIRKNGDKTIYTQNTSNNVLGKRDSSQSNELKRNDKNYTASVCTPDLTELTRWFYEIGTIYDALKTVVDGCCTTISKDKLLELRMRSREYVENCRTLLLSGQNNRMARVRVKSVLEEITKQINIPPSKMPYWKSRLQVCQQQLLNLHNRVEGSNYGYLLEPYIRLKEFEVNAAKTHHKAMHAVKINSIYVNKTEIYGYLSVLGKDCETDAILPFDSYDEHNSTGINEFAEITFPLYKKCLTGSNFRCNGRTKCDKGNSRQISVMRNNNL